MAPVCTNCNGTDFVWANDLKTGAMGAGLSLRSRGEVPLGARICRTCGHAELFLRDLSILHQPHTWRPGEFVPIVAKPAAKPTEHHHHAEPAPAPAPTAAPAPPPPPPPPAPVASPPPPEPAPAAPEPTVEMPPSEPVADPAAASTAPADAAESPAAETPAKAKPARRRSTRAKS